MDMDPAVIFFSVFFSFAGMAYYAYGKKHGLYFQLAGVVLLIVTFCVNSYGY